MIEIESEILSEIIGCNTYHKSALKYGHRAWLAKGKELTAIYWDEGNGWCSIIHLIPKDFRKGKEIVKRFYKKLKNAIERNYDNKGMRVSN